MIFRQIDLMMVVMSVRISLAIIMGYCGYVSGTTLLSQFNALLLFTTYSLLHLLVNFIYVCVPCTSFCLNCRKKSSFLCFFFGKNRCNAKCNEKMHTLHILHFVQAFCGENMHAYRESFVCYLFCE